MSDARAIAATTATLRNLLLRGVPLLDPTLSDLEVTAQPLDLARRGVTSAQLNLFLYETVVNGAWRNMDIPYQVRPGETSAPPLPLDLRYLITAFGREENDNEAVSHRVLGGALSLLHDHPVIGRDEIALALPDTGLEEQFERLRITQLPLSLDEMSKLWTAFQTQYRLSTAFEVTVALIHSRRPTRSVLPVLRRGTADRGAAVLAGGFPELREILPPRSQPAVRLGEDLVIRGERLTSGNATARFTHLRLDSSVSMPFAAGDRADEIRVHLADQTQDPNALSRWAPGFYAVALVVARPGLPPLASNARAFALAPRIVVTPTAATAGTITLTIRCEPRIVDGQGVSLLFGDRQAAYETIDTPADPTQPTTLTFVIPDVAAGIYTVRLRVDGVDSIPVVVTGTPPLPAFDPAQQVVVT